jgi:hypothetical protein
MKGPVLHVSTKAYKTINIVGKSILVRLSLYIVFIFAHIILTRLSYQTYNREHYIKHSWAEDY